MRTPAKSLTQIVSSPRIGNASDGQIDGQMDRCKDRLTEIFASAPNDQMKNTKQLTAEKQEQQQ